MPTDDLFPTDGSGQPQGRLVVDPGGVEAKGAEPAGKPRRAHRRTRPAVGPKVKVESHTLDLSRVEAMLVGLHALAAQMTKTPELEVSKVEIHDWLENVKAVASHYEVEVAQKSLDWTMLILSTGAIWGVRAIDITVRRERERHPRRETATVVPFPVMQQQGTPATPEPHVEITPEPDMGGDPAA